MRAFHGFPAGHDLTGVKDKLQKYSVDDLKDMAVLFNLERSGDKSALVERLTGFLQKPQDYGASKAIPVKSKSSKSKKSVKKNEKKIVKKSTKKSGEKKKEGEKKLAGQKRKAPVKKAAGGAKKSAAVKKVEKPADEAMEVEQPHQEQQQ